MKKYLKNFLYWFGMFFIGLVFGFTLKNSLAWVEPSDQGNILTFINSGGAAQSKLGGLALNVSGALVGLVVDKGLVGIGTTNPQGIVDVTSTASGLIPPRMTTAERNAISLPQFGMVIINSDTKKMNIYNGSAWEAAGEGTSAETNIVYGSGDGGEGNNFCRRSTISNDGQQGTWTNINEGLTCGTSKKCASGNCVSF